MFLPPGGCAGQVSLVTGVHTWHHASGLEIVHRRGSDIARSALRIVAGAPPVSNLCFTWQLRPAGGGTEISVHVEIPEEEAHRVETQRDIIRRSVANLAGLAAG